MITSDHPQFEFFRRGQFFGGVEDIADDASTELLPLTRFDREHLRRTRGRRSEKEAEAALARRIGKSCAGLAPEYRCSAAELRAAIREGTLDERQQRCFDWTLSGMRSFEIHELYNKWELSIWEIARTIARTYGAASYTESMAESLGRQPVPTAARPRRVDARRAGARTRIRDRPQNQRPDRSDEDRDAIEPPESAGRCQRGSPSRQRRHRTPTGASGGAPHPRERRAQCRPYDQPCIVPGTSAPRSTSSRSVTVTVLPFDFTSHQNATASSCG